MKPSSFRTIAVVLTALGCGSAQSTVSSPPASSSAHEASSNDWQGRSDSAAEESTPSPCYAQCRELIDKANAVFQQAQGEDEPARRRTMDRAGEAYIAAWRGCSLETHVGMDLQCEGASLVAPRMLDSFRASDRYDRAIFAILVTRDRRWRTDTAPTNQELKTAVSAAENAFASQPQAAQAREWVRMAAYGRIALGDVSFAQKDMESFVKGASKSEQQEHAAMRVAMASRLNDQGEHASAQRLLGTTSPEEPARVAAGWHAEMGRALAGQNRSAQASFDRALAVWQAVPSSQWRQQLGPAEPWPMWDRERGIETIGAAHFYSAERLRTQTVLPFPAYRGSGAMKDVAEYLETKVGSYVRERQARLLKAEEAYQKISEIQPVAPSRWLVASACRIGQMWAALVQDVTQSPLPPSIAKDPDIAAGYRKTLQESLRPVDEKARRAFIICRDTAQRFGIDDDFSRACHSWLADNPEP